MTAALVLDEMFSPEIAAELSKRGHDVVAIAAHPALAGLPDDQILAWAAEQRRCLLTENVKDFETLRRQCAAQGISHPGLLYSGLRRFPRDRRFLGALVAALDQLLAAGQVPGPDEVSWLLPL
jgi:Domain of unknown function (DUF5615)